MSKIKDLIEWMEKKVIEWDGLYFSIVLAKAKELLKEEEGEQEEKWTPTPWEMIEVSNDGETWTRWTFDWYKTLQNKVCIKEGDDYEYARPLQEEMIEELIPMDDLCEDCNDSDRIIYKRCELLTNTVNQLIRKLK